MHDLLHEGTGAPSHLAATTEGAPCVSRVRLPSAGMSATAAAVLQQRLGLTDDELLAVLDADPLTLVSGELDHAPQLAILLALTDEPAQRLGEPTLQRWLRTSGPSGRPLDHLTNRDFGAFEDALDRLAERGFVISASRRRR
jgi:hypothetical protein